MSQQIHNKRIILVTWALIAIGIIYILLIAIGILLADPETGLIVDPIRIAMEITTILSSLVLLLYTLLFYELYKNSNPTWNILSLVFMSLVMAFTSVCHFISISIGQELVKVNEVFSYIISLNWPSILMAVDIFAWDLLFGISFIFFGIGLYANAKNRIASLLFILSGALSVLGLIAIPLNNMNIRFIGIFGYTIMPIISCTYFMISINKNRKMAKFA